MGLRPARVALKLCIFRCARVPQTAGASSLLGLRTRLRESVNPPRYPSVESPSRVETSIGGASVSLETLAQARSDSEVR